MPIKRVDFDVLAFIVSLNKKQFTISCLDEAYLASPNCQHNSPRSSRQFLYRSIIKYEKLGLLRCLPSTGSKAHQYELIDTGDTYEKKETVTTTPLDPTLEITARIRDKIKKYKLDLLKAIGETEAYKEWAEEMPTLRGDVQTQYNSARDESAKLLGKVNAYESLLEKYQGR
jgi:hypothetical protein